MMMKIVIAPDSFKESMTALEAATAIKMGFDKVLPNAEYIKVPMADGGEGTVQSLVDATNGRIIYETVTGPLGDPVDAFYGLTGDGKTAVIEMAAASGLHLVSEEKRNPLKTTTKGTGELIRKALNKGVKHLIIGLGGSATNDGGAGMAQALGVKLLDTNGNQSGYGGGELKKLDSIDVSNIDPRLTDTVIEVACDVDNPLTGERGAAVVFGPEKGASPEVVQRLDDNLGHCAEILKRDLDKDIAHIPGTAEAGGLAAGLVAFVNVNLKRGDDIVLDFVGLEEKIKDATLVITGEANIDRDTIYGKTPIGVAKIAKKYSIPVIGIAGSIGEQSEVVYEYGIDALFTIVPGAVELEEAIKHAEQYTVGIAENIARIIQLTKV